MPKHHKKTPPALSPWRRIHVDVAAAVADAVSGLLIEEGALGLETEDDETRAVPGKALRVTGRALVTATFSREAGLEARVVKKVVALAEYLPEATDATVEWSDLWPEDWNAIFRQHWKPFRCGTRVWVCPSWERDHFHAERVGAGVPPIVLYLDAGMAFGTGTHETTQLCIEAVEARGDKLGRVLDVGTGTGILSIAALKLGATFAKGTDIDPVAVATSLENALNNGVNRENNVRAIAGKSRVIHFVANADMPDAEGAIWDTVIANILAGTLIELSSSIVAAVKPGGALFLSGVLVDQEPAVRDAFVKLGMHHEHTAAKNGWVRIDLVKPTP